MNNKAFYVTHDEGFGYHAVTFGYGGLDCVTIECINGEYIQITETHDSGSGGTRYAAVTVKEFLAALGLVAVGGTHV